MLLAFSLIAVIGAVAMVLALLAPAGRRAPPDPPLVATVRQLLHHPAMIMALCFAFCVSVTISTVDLLAVLELGNRGIGATMIGLAFSFGAVLGVGFGALAGRLADRYGSFGLCLAGSVGLVAICLVLAAPLPNWALIGALIAMGPLFPLMMTGIYPLIAATSDELGLSHGTANGFVNICWSTTFGVMPLIAAQIAEWDGDDAAYLAAAATTAVLAVIAVLMRSRARNLSLSH